MAPSLGRHYFIVDNLEIAATIVVVVVVVRVASVVVDDIAIAAVRAAAVAGLLDALKRDTLALRSRTKENHRINSHPILHE